MTVSVKRKDDQKESFENIWEVQSNKESSEVILVGYDHLIHSKERMSDIKSIQIDFD